MDEGQQCGATDSHSPSHEIRQTTEAHCILPQQVLRGAELEVHFRILVGSSPLASELVLERRTLEFHCVVVIFGDGNSGFSTKAISSMLMSSKPFSATLTVWHITLGAGASCDSSSVGLSTRVLHAGTQLPRQWNEHAVPTAASRCVLAVGRGTQLAQKSAVSSFLHTASGYRLYWPWRRQNASPK